MASITFKGKPISTVGDLPSVGSKAPDFRLTKADLGDVNLSSFKGKRKILNIVPSLDTGVCAASARRFDQEAGSLPNTVVLTISNDLPFAQNRFCQSEHLNSIVTLSSLRNKDFGKQYGVEIKDGPLEGLLSRAIVVLDETDTVQYVEQVPEIAQEPDYTKALQAVKSI